MAELVKCFECGARVSSSANPCPRCGHPISGYNCKICGRRDKNGNMQSFYMLGKFHEECMEKVKQEYASFHQYRCPVCSYSDKTLANAKQCTKCGHPFNGIFDTIFCKKCGFSVVSIAATDGCHKFCYYHSKKKICFLATALYGEDSSKVRMLCFFRDEYLSASSLGRAFIALYVRFSPPLARAIAKESLLRTLVRYCIVTPALLFTEKFLVYVGRKEKLKQ